MNESGLIALEEIFRPERYFNAKTVAGLYHNSRLVMIDDIAKNQEGLLGFASNPVRSGNSRRQTLTMKWPYQNNPLLSNPRNYSYLLQGIDVGVVEEQILFGNRFHELVFNLYDRRHEAIASISDNGKVNMKRVSSTDTVYPLYTEDGWKKLKEFLYDRIMETGAVPAF